MGNALILQDDIYRLTGAVVTDPTAAAGFPWSRVRDYRDYLAAKPASSGDKDYDVDLGTGGGGTPGAKKPDTLGILGHNLVGKTIEVYEGAAFPPATLVKTVVVPADRIVLRYDAAAWTSKRYHRIRFKALATSSQVSEVHLGRALVFPQGIDWEQFDPQAERIRGRATRSQEGFALRTVVEFAERSARVQLSLLTNAFLQDTTDPTGFRYWWDNFGARGFPFIWAWNPGDPGAFESDAFWAVVRFDRGIDRALRTPVAGGYRDLALEVQGRKE